MGDVIQFKPAKRPAPACPCGWLAPMNVQVQMELQVDSVSTCIVAFNCPTCSRRLQMGHIEDQTAEDAGT